MLDAFYFAIKTTAPIFCIITLGILFRRIGWVTDEFARVGSSLVFKVTLPCLLFVKIVQTDFNHDLPTGLVLYAFCATIAVFLLLDRLAAPRLQEVSDRGVFVQGAFRGNMGIIGLAYCLSAFGESVVAKASIYMAVMTILFNILAVITLTRHQGAREQRDFGRIFLNIAKNPLILSICAALIFSLNEVQVSEILLETGGYFARMTLPLALLCAGASIRLHEFQSSRPLYWAVSGKLFFVPLLLTIGCIIFGLRGDNLGVLFLMSASPTAAASYPMAQSMGTNYHLAAAIIAATSLGSVASITLGIFLLRSFGLI